jgi:preprotein translocase subunit YajC
MISTALQLLAVTPAPQAAPDPFTSMLIPMICIFVIMYFLIIRPQSKKQKALAAMISELKTGDRVVTSGGIHGVVANIKEGSVLSLRVADNVKIDVDKAAIASVDRGSEVVAAK